MLNTLSADFARWRSWAADLRDAGGPYAETAALLCRVLDLHDDMSRRSARPDSAANLADGLRPCIDVLVRRLVEGGAAMPPAISRSQPAAGSRHPSA